MILDQVEEVAEWGGLTMCPTRSIGNWNMNFVLNLKKRELGSYLPRAIHGPSAVEKNILPSQEPKSNLTLEGNKEPILRKKDIMRREFASSSGKCIYPRPVRNVRTKFNCSFEVLFG